MPITLADKGEEVIIRKIGGSHEVKLHLQNLGLVPGESCTVISENNGNLIIRFKETRLAIDSYMAARIMY